MIDANPNKIGTNNLKKAFILIAIFFLTAPVNAKLFPSVRVFSQEEHNGKEISVTCHNSTSNTKILDVTGVVVGQELFYEKRIESNNNDGDGLSCTINGNIECVIEEGDDPQRIYVKYPAELTTETRKPWEFHLGYDEENGKATCYLFPDFIPDDED